MNLHEYQAKQLIAKYGISVPKGIAIKSPDELDQSIVQLDSSIRRVSTGWPSGLF